MKKLLIICAFIAGLLLAVSCEGNKRCPAYEATELIVDNVHSFDLNIFQVK